VRDIQSNGIVWPARRRRSQSSQFPPPRPNVYSYKRSLMMMSQRKK
jgi:hypothetical protein